MLQHAKDVLRGEPRYLEAAEKFENSVADVSEFLVKLGPVRPEKPVETVATYHDSCHLSHGMGVRGEPRQLLSLVPGLRMVPLRESDICCGAAGTYNMTEPEMSGRLSDRKIANIAETGAKTVITGNVVCHMQISEAVRERRLDAEVIHTMDVLARAYGVS
jgi:glycolate oxidase iron-sulfur subunit